MRFRSLAFSRFVLAGLIAVSLTNTAWTADTRGPNVLFLFTDDQRPDTIAALGNPVIKTPALDRLARNGFVFRNCYCFGSNVPAVCQPSRNMLMTGKAYFRWEGRQAPPDAPNFPVTLKQAGYYTYHHGKSGNVAKPINEKFDVNKYLNDEADRNSGEPGKTIVDEAIEFLRSRVKQRQDTDSLRPFFMYLALGNPHDPRVAVPKYMDLYKRDQLPLPRNFMALHPFDNGEQLVRDELLAPFPRTADEIRRHLHEYYAVISGMDYHLGRLLDALKELKLDDNTLIIFSADNGLAVGSHGLMGKQNLYEHSARVPLIFSGPGIPKGQSDALVYLMDIFPTVCERVGMIVPAGLDGKSLMPVVQGRAQRVRDTLFMAYREVQRGVRDERWKLIRYPKIDKTQLFDLKTDPDELHDLAGGPDSQQRIASLMGELGSWQQRLGDPTPLTVSNPQDPTFTPPREGDK